MNGETARIEKYLDGQMSADERADFEKNISENPVLKEELQLHRQMRLFLAKRDGRLQLEQQLQQIGAEYFPQQSSQTIKGRGNLTPIFRRYGAIMAVAASFALLIAAYFLLRTPLYDQFATHPPLALVEKSATQEQLQYEAETAFNSRNYEQAEVLLEQLLRNHPDDLIRIYLGIAKMEAGKIQEARKLFTEVTSEDPAIRDFAQWNLVLSYLKTGDKERCRELAKKLPPDSPYFEKAKKLLKKL